MLWVAMAYYLWLRGLGPVDRNPEGVGALGIALTAVGANGWHPLRVNSIIPVGWTIGVEMSFYLVFPFLFFWINSLKRAVIAFMLSIVMAQMWTTFGISFVVPEFSQSAQHKALAQDFVGYFSLLP